VCSHRRIIAVITAAGFGVLLSLGMLWRMTHITTPLDIEYFAHGTSVTISGWITEPPDVRPTVTKLTVSVTEITNANGTHSVRGRVLFNDIGAWPAVLYGDYVTITGKLTVPEVIDSFDYPHYLEISGIRAIMTRGTIKTSLKTIPPTLSDRPWWLIGKLSAIRTSVENQIGLVLPEPHASLLAGLLTGTRRGLSADLSDSFRRSGLTHIVAVSGYNVTIILTLCSSFLFWVPIKKRLLPLALGAGLFALFVGAGAPVVRAAIMGTLGLIALSAGRVATTRLLILWTAFLMVLWNPIILWYDASFQLSFLAVLGLSEVSPWLKPLLRRVTETLAIRESLTATLAAQIATLPLSVLLFHQFSLIAPVSNILVAPLIPFSMLLGFLATMLSYIWMPLGLIVGYYAWFTLELILKIAVISSSLSFASLSF
jgi:competence protein ComEC